MNVQEKVELVNKAFRDGKWVTISTECSKHLITLVNPIPENADRKYVIQLLDSKDGDLKPYIILKDAFEFAEVEALDDKVPDTVEVARQAVRDDRLHWNPLPLSRPMAPFVNPNGIWQG